MALAALTVEPGGIKKSKFLVGLLLQQDYGFIWSRDERLYVVILHFDPQNLIEVQDGFLCVANLEILIDYPCHLPSLEKAFFFLHSFLNE